MNKHGYVTAIMMLVAWGIVVAMLLAMMKFPRESASYPQGYVDSLMVQ